MWDILFLLLLASLLPFGLFCPSNCVCNSNGAVKCTGGITEIPPLNASQTFLLRLNGTSIKALNAQSLQPLNLLLRFSITYSSLDTVHPKVFSNAPQLMSIMLSYNALSVLPSGVFSRLSNLEQLFIAGNQLTSISKYMFEGLGNLTELDLSKNQIANLPANVFQDMTSLTRLNLAGNLLRTFPPTLVRNLVKLKSLILNSNQLQRLEEGSFDDLPNLSVLMLHKNQIQEISPQIFWRLPSLLTLTLSGNQLQSIPAESFYYLPNLTKLTLYNNPLFYLPDQLMGHMPRLPELYLFETNLRTLPWNLFANMTGLKSLHVHLNERLSSLPKNIFCCLPNLQKLSLRNNHLQDLHPELFSKLVQLKILLLYGNELQTISGRTFENLSNLIKLDLNNNYLRYVPGDIFASVSSLQSVTLGHNQWHCTCSIIGIKEWIDQNKQLVTDLDDVVCHSPLSLRGLKLIFLIQSQLQCGNMSALTEHGFVTNASVSHQQTTVSTATSPVPGQQTTMGIDPTTTKSVSTTLPTNTSPTIQSPPQSSISIPSTEDPWYSVVSSLTDPVFIDRCPDIVHNNRYNGWVYLWKTPAPGLYSGLLLTLHIVLISIAVILIVATAYSLYSLNKVVWEMGTSVTRIR
ncbi:platelet glycoprotein V [Hoplias malabaricus]|uniref:platelet glycoprotein V n=1 Tax=Hoplias malabaricus TaxID=27720 RepID=UPI0034627EAF